MPFFLPGRLINFEYFVDGEEPDKEYQGLAKQFQSEIDFAFFAVNFKYSKRDYEELTPCEKAFIYKAWENKTVNDTQHIANAVNNAIANANRKKGKKAIPLWKKKQKRLNKETAMENLELIQNVEKQEGKAWVDAIYKANGLSIRKVESHGS